MITEPDVTLTDYALGVECGVFSYLLYRQGNSQRPLRVWFSLFFGSLGLAALTGGSVHGFFPDANMAGHAILWPATLLAIGVTALATWTIGARIQFSGAMVRWISIAAAAGLVVYCFLVLFVIQTFWIAIAHYLPATIFLLFAFWTRYQRKREPAMLIGTVGLLLTFVAAGVQIAAITPHPIYFNHNALYHLIQAVALLLIFWGAKGINFAEGIA